MDTKNNRFSLSAEKYLEKHHVLTYIEDALSQLLEHKEENSKVNTSKFLCDYFVSVRDGNHTLFREYAFMKATAHNRSSFVKKVWKAYLKIGKKGDLLTIKEYHSLLCLLCPDFPFTPVQKTAKIILMDESLDTVISFSDFLYAFQVQFCFDEFLTRCAEVYKELLKTKQTSHDPVYVPTSEEATPIVHEDENSTAQPEGVDAMTFLRSLIPLCEHFESLAPPLPVLKDILSSAERVTFYGYLMALAKSERLNTAIGKIPNKAELFESTEQELSSPPLRPGSAGNTRTNNTKTSAKAGSAHSLQQNVHNSQPTVPAAASAPPTPTNQQSAGNKTAVSQSHTASGASNSTPASTAIGGAAVKSVPTMKSTRLQKRMLRKQVSTDSDDSDDSTDTN